MNPLVAAAQEMVKAAAEYSEEEMMEVKAHIETLPEVFLTIAAAIRVWTEALHANHPLNDDVLEILRQLYEETASLAPSAEEVANTFHKSHEDDIRRHEAPRTGEEKWNV